MAEGPNCARIREGDEASNRHDIEAVLAHLAVEPLEFFEDGDGALDDLVNRVENYSDPEDAERASGLRLDRM